MRISKEELFYMIEKCDIEFDRSRALTRGMNIVWLDVFLSSISSLSETTIIDDVDDPDEEQNKRAHRCYRRLYISSLRSSFTDIYKTTNRYHRKKKKKKKDAKRIRRRRKVSY